MELSRGIISVSLGIWIFPDLSILICFLLHITMFIHIYKNSIIPQQKHIPNPSYNFKLPTYNIYKTIKHLIKRINSWIMFACHSHSSAKTCWTHDLQSEFNITVATLFSSTTTTIATNVEDKQTHRRLT